MYEYRARTEHVVDGDTMDVTVDLGFHITRRVRLRLAGVDTHETYGVDHNSEEYQRGKRETEWVRRWLQQAADGRQWPLLVRTEKKGKYGRYLAEIERVTDGAVLNDDLRAEFEGVDSS